MMMSASDISSSVHISKLVPNRTHDASNLSLKVREACSGDRRQRVVSLAYFPFFGYFAESHYSRSIVSYAKTRPENRIPGHRKTESHAAPAQERRRAHAGIPHRARGRAADRRLPGQ